MAEFYKGDIPILDTDLSAHRDTLFPAGASFGMTGRDWTEFPEGTFGEPPSEMETIDDPSEWDARYDEQERTESSLEHIYLRGGKHAFVNLDQNGDGHCHTADTEVLTDRGFVAWPDYNWRDLLATVNPLTHRMEFQAPLERHVYDYDGPMVYSTNRRVDFGVTPGHQMYVRKWDERKRTLSPDYSFVKADNIGWYAGLLHAPSGWAGTELVELEIPGDRRYDGDDLIALLGLVISDGYAGGAEGASPGKGTMNWVSFASFREDIRPAVESLAKRVGFHESPSRRGVWIRYNAGALAEWMRSNCYTGGGLGARNKRVPELVKVASVRQIKLFLHWFDDRIRSGRQFFSTSRRLIDDLQELHLRIGKRSVVDKTAAKEHVWKDKVFHSSPAFTLTVSEADRLCLERKKHIERERYKGPVYCAAVPNHTLITRRNGTTLISSNCWAYSTAHAWMLSRLRNYGTTPRLNPHFIATYLKRFDGGWCGASGKVIQEIGCPEEGDGPDQWPLHSNDTRLLTPERLAAAAQHKSVEEWRDLSRQVWEQKMVARQLATCGFLNIPAPSDFNFWSHSVCQVRWCRIEKGSWGPLILNSWANWGRHGLAVLRGSQATANGAIAIRTTT